MCHHDGKNSLAVSEQKIGIPGDFLSLSRKIIKKPVFVKDFLLRLLENKRDCARLKRKYNNMR